MSRSQKNNNTTKTAQRSKGSAINLIFKPVGWGLDIIVYIAFSIMLGTLIEWCGLFFGLYPTDHAKQILQTELLYLGDNFTTTLFGVSAQRLAQQIVVFFNAYIHTASTTQGDAVMIVLNWVKSLGNEFIPYVNAMIYVVMITTVRCVIITLSTVSFVIVGIAAMVDGLHIRELRKVGGDDEHGDVYHWSKASISKIIVLSPVIYLAYPDSINPNFILLPAMGLFFIALFLFFSKYKKVL